MTPYFEEAGITVTSAKSDADYLIVRTTVDFSKTCTDDVVLVGQDTDLMALLIFHNTEGNVAMLRPGTAGKSDKLTNIRKLQTALGDKVCHNILFAHAVSGCDTTSAFYKKGKTSALTTLQKDETLSQSILIFNDVKAPMNELLKQGEAFILKWYGAKKCKTLDNYRYIKYNQGVGKAESLYQFRASITSYIACC
uniref:Uncharacterized protein n=1 Tax=Photinus pyralis TaxID=7054 RepID=A0A1Y1KNT3_PHOPY